MHFNKTLRRVGVHKMSMPKPKGLPITHTTIPNPGNVPKMTKIRVPKIRKF